MVRQFNLVSVKRKKTWQPYVRSGFNHRSCQQLSANRLNTSTSANNPRTITGAESGRAAIALMRVVNTFILKSSASAFRGTCRPSAPVHLNPKCPVCLWIAVNKVHQTCHSCSKSILSVITEITLYISETADPRACPDSSI